MKTTFAKALAVARQNVHWTWIVNSTNHMYSIISVLLHLLNVLYPLFTLTLLRTSPVLQWSAPWRQSPTGVTSRNVTRWPGVSCIARVGRRTGPRGRRTTTGCGGAWGSICCNTMSSLRRYVRFLTAKTVMITKTLDFLTRNLDLFIRILHLSLYQRLQSYCNFITRVTFSLSNIADLL